MQYSLIDSEVDWLKNTLKIHVYGFTNQTGQALKKIQNKVNNVVSAWTKELSKVTFKSVARFSNSKRCSYFKKKNQISKLRSANIHLPMKNFLNFITRLNRRRVTKNAAVGLN